MKKSILTLIAFCALAAAPAASASSYNVLLAGDSEANDIAISLSPDGRNYLIDSIVPLEVGGDICTHPDSLENELICRATAISSFEVNAGGGDDRVSVAKEVTIPVTIRGGPGNDRLIGGSGPDRLIGGGGDDKLLGGRGHDSLYGGPGDDWLIGGQGDDLLRGGPGRDLLFGGSGRNRLRHD